MSETWLSVPRPGSACSVIAEVSQTHDGSLGTAHAFIDAAAAAGADAIKFQTHIASAEGTPGGALAQALQPAGRVPLRLLAAHGVLARAVAGAQGARGQVRTALPELAVLDGRRGALTRVGVSAWKVASGEINNHPLLDAMAQTGLPVMISTGMSPLEEIDAAVERVRGRDVPVAVMQCTSMYPTPPEHVGLDLIPEFRERYGCSVGLSDHSATIYPGLAAATLGAELLEVHITLSREMFGPDVVASITTAELRQLVEGVRFIEKMRANPGDKAALPESVTSLRRHLHEERRRGPRPREGDRADPRRPDVQEARHGDPREGRSHAHRQKAAPLPRARRTAPPRRSGGERLVTRKICVVITARPSYSRIRSVLEAIRERPELELQLVVAASALLDRYGNTWKVIENEGYRIDRRVYMVLEGENLVTSAKSTGFGMAELATVFDHLRPDAVVTIATATRPWPPPSQPPT